MQGDIFTVKNEDDQAIGRVVELGIGRVNTTMFVAWIYRHTDEPDTAVELEWYRELAKAEQAICDHYDLYGLPDDIEEETW